MYASEAQDVVENLALIDALHRALNSADVPPHVMNVLLDLAEFMEMQDKPLPLDVQMLANRAQDGNMFAKSMRYREIEFTSPNMLPSTACIESLITVNNELGLLDRASGVLKYVATHYAHIAIEPQWLQKLHFWEDARQSYQQQNVVFSEASPNDRPPTNSAWMASELGNLQCLLALGEFDQLAESSTELMNHLKCCPSVEHYNQWMSEIQKLGANASWMLGNWQALEVGNSNGGAGLA